MGLKEIIDAIRGKKGRRKAILKDIKKEYRIDKDFIEARIEVRDLSKFLHEFVEFMRLPDVKRVTKCIDVEIVLDASAAIDLRYKGGPEGTGYVHNLRIRCGSDFIGIIIAKFFDRRLFLTSPQMRRLVRKEETIFLKTSWMVPIEPVTVFLKPEYTENFAEKFWHFVEFYRDDYPNPLAARIAPMLSEVKK